MIFFNKKPLRIKTAKKEVAVRLDGQCPLNLAYDGEALRQSLGVEPLTLTFLGNEESITGIGDMKRLYGYANRLYGWDGQEIRYLMGDEMIPVVACPVEPEFSPCTLDGKSSAWLSAPDLLLRCTQRTEAYLNPLCLRRLHTLENTLFAISFNNNFLYFDQNDPAGWDLDDLAYVALNGIGAPRCLNSHNGCVYVFGEYGVTRVRHSGGRAMTYALCVLTEKIIPDTVSLRGGSFYFCTEKSVFRLTGSTLSEIYKFDGRFPQSCSRAAFFGDAYVAALSDGALLALYMKGDRVYPSLTPDAGVYDIADFPQIGRTALLTAGGAGVLSMSGRLFYKSLTKVFYAPLALDGVLSLKRLNSVTLTSRFDVFLTVNADGTDHSRMVYASKTPQTLPLNLTGRTFTLTLTSRAPSADIRDVTVCYDIISKY